MDELNRYGHWGALFLKVVGNLEDKEGKGISPMESDIKKYLDQVKAIFESFAKTHNCVVIALAKASKASEVDARSQLNQLLIDLGFDYNVQSQTKIMKQLKELDMCITLSTLGNDLTKWKTTGVLDRYDQKFFDQFVETLRGAETRAAEAYQAAFWILHQKFINNNSSIEDLTKDMKIIMYDLIEQRNEFNRLAKEAMEKSEQLETRS